MSFIGFSVPGTSSFLSLFFFTPLLKKVDLIPQLGSICLGVMVTSLIFLPVARASFAGQSGGPTHMLPKRGQQRDCLDLDHPELHLNL